MGIGIAACVACCAGPILAFLTGLTVTGLASTLVIGSAGLAITGLALAGIVAVRRRRATAACHAPPSDPVSVAAPTRKVSP